MYCTIDAATLKSALTESNRAVSKRTTLPVLANVRAEVTDRGLTLTTTDLEQAVVLTIPIDDDAEAGAVTFPCRAALDFAKVAPKGSSVRLERLSDTGVRLQHAAGGITLGAIDADEYPVITTNGTATFTFDGPAFIGAIGRVIVSADDDEARSILTGTCFTLRSDGAVEIAAADNYRIGVERVRPVNANGADVEPFVVPARCLKTLAAVGKRWPQVYVILHRNANRVIFGCDDQSVVSRLIDGTFPNYQSILPVSWAVSSRFDAAAFMSALKMVQPVAAACANVVRLYANSSLAVSAHLPYPQQDGAQSASSDIPAETDLPDGMEGAEIAANLRYLSDTVGTMAGRVTLTMNDRLAPMGFTCDAYPDYRVVVMPVRTA
jgi:DNA polymerase-3 subunit beta